MQHIRIKSILMILGLCLGKIVNMNCLLIRVALSVIANLLLLL